MLPLIIIVVSGGYVILSTAENQLIGPLLKSSANQVNNPLRRVVENSLADSKGIYGIAIKHLNTEKGYFLNEHRVFETGSLYKLWVMAAVYKQIQDGLLTEDEVLSQDVAALNQEFNIDPESAELTDGIVTFTVHDALKQMITISHNYAALLLTEKIKLSSVANFLKVNGFTESSVGVDGDAPKSTASDIALFYEKLYKRELANAQYTQEMIDLLKGQQLDEGLPKYLPDQLPVANKTGDMGWFKHDAGIVYYGATKLANSPGGEAAPLVSPVNQEAYIIVVMSESESPLGAQERIAIISKAVFDYFSKK